MEGSTGVWLPQMTGTSGTTGIVGGAGTIGGSGSAPDAGGGNPCTFSGSAHPKSAASISAQSAAKRMFAFMTPFLAPILKSARITPL